MDGIQPVIDWDGPDPPWSRFDAPPGPRTPDQAGRAPLRRDNFGKALLDFGDTAHLTISEGYRMNTGELLEQLLATDSATRVGELLDIFCEANPEVGWRPVGDKVNNTGPVGAASDPARALLERVTNGIDAVIQRSHDDHGGQPQCNSPRDAAQA